MSDVVCCKLLAWVRYAKWLLNNFQYFSDAYISDESWGSEFLRRCQNVCQALFKFLLSRTDKKNTLALFKAMCVTLLSFNPVSLSFLDLGGDPPTCTIIRRMPSYRENKNYIILFFTIGSLGTFYQSLSCTNTRTHGHRAKVFLSCHRSTWRNTLSKLIHRFFKV